MNSKFIDALTHEDNFTLTENDATALKSTGESLVDLFGRIGTMRETSPSDVAAAFSKAFAEDKLLALKIAFYARDVRGGLGERETFRVIIRHLAILYPGIIRRNLHNIPVFGRFDDLYALVGTMVEADMWALIRDQFDKDLESYKRGESVSLMAKWLKSCNTSSAESRKLGRMTAKALGLSERHYRKNLSKLRKHIDVVEVKMSSRQWSKINYPGVTSRAMMTYRKAFLRKDPVRFEEYIAKLKTGETKINSGTLYPYDILERLGLDSFYGDYFSMPGYDEILEAQWKALPNYIEGENNVLVMADTSASMSGRPICTSVGLAIYFAERNKGVFKDTFMTFSSKPSLVKLKGETLFEKVKCIPAIVDNTNLEKAFELILKTAVDNQITQEEMPKALIIISDMQFDQQTDDRDLTWHNAMKKKFQQAGYELPNVVYWNVRDTRESFQTDSRCSNIQIASGQSTAIFKSVLSNIGCNPFEAMVNTINVPRYDCIVI